MAIIGAGGIGFDVAELLSHAEQPRCGRYDGIFRRVGVSIRPVRRKAD